VGSDQAGNVPALVRASAVEKGLGSLLGVSASIPIPQKNRKIARDGGIFPYSPAVRRPIIKG